MAKELTETLRKFDEKSIEDTLRYLTSVLEKAIKYYNFKIAELEEKIKMVELRFELKQKTIKSKELNELTPTPSKPEVKNDALGNRSALMKDLKKTLKGMKNGKNI